VGERVSIGGGSRREGHHRRHQGFQRAKSDKKGLKTQIAERASNSFSSKKEDRCAKRKISIKKRKNTGKARDGEGKKGRRKGKKKHIQRLGMRGGGTP